VKSSELSDNIIIVAVFTSRYSGRIDCICMPCRRQCPELGHAAMHQRVIQNGGMVTQPPSPVAHQAGVLKAPALSKSDSVSCFQLWNPPRLRTTGHACPRATFLQPCVGIGRYPANQKKRRDARATFISDRRPRPKPVGGILGRLSHTHAITIPRPATSHR
jgi:hypothetical protein